MIKKKTPSTKVTIREDENLTVPTKKGKKKMSKAPTDVAYRGTEIVLPEISGKKMSYDTAIEVLTRKKQEEEQVVNIHYVFAGSPLDGAVAFHRALKEKFGWAELVTVQTMFGPRPPTMVGVECGPNGETTQVPWGTLSIPGMEAQFQTGFDAATPAFTIGGQVRRRHLPEIEEIVALTRRNLIENSIYKGKALRVDLSWQRNEEDYHPFKHAPKFMNTNNEAESTLIFGDEVQNQLNIGLFTPIEFKEACRKHNVPLKRGVLLYGPYGTGKTLTATVTAVKAMRAGWTFIYLNDVRDLAEGLRFAAQYAPAIIFAEDIDRVMTGGRSVEMDSILNTLDGIDTKNGEIITVFTTNHIEHINPAVLRMGRLDMLVEVKPPDAKAAERLVRLYGRGLIDDETGLSRVGERLAGKIPAFIREVTERAKVSAIRRHGGELPNNCIDEEDLLNAASAMEAHNNFLKPKFLPGTPPETRVVVQLNSTDKQAERILANFENSVN